MANRWISGFDYVKEVGKYIWPPVKRHIHYWWCLDENIQGLRDEIHHLERVRLDLLQKIEEARLRAESVTAEVMDWSNEVTQKLEEATGILQSCYELKPWNIIPQYLAGKSAKKIAEGIAKLRTDGNAVRISDPPPPPSMVSIFHKPMQEFESRRRIEEDIMESLIDDYICMIAICGAGGVGKTTMVQRIEDRVRREKLFDEVVHVVVHQQIDMLKIQKEVAELLGLTLSDDTLAGRAHKLHIRLLDSKRKLIVFDDVWKRFDLTNLGVPFGGDFKRCKIILSSRFRYVCEEMEAHKVIQIEALDEKEAWRLFREKSGNCVDGLDLLPIAENIVAECRGLPIALVTVGNALKNESIHVWRDSLCQLIRSNPTNLPQLLETVYNPLKLIYDLLETESEKSLFLLCCLFPEDYDIPIELLSLYSIGLGMFEGIRNIDEGRNRTYHLVERLKSCFLLINGRHEQNVKMHDVVRDMAIFIGSKEKQGFLISPEVRSMDSSSKDSSRNCNWMSIDISIQNNKLPIGSDFPNLRLLMIRNSRVPYGKPSQAFDANVIYLERMEKLNVLSFTTINFRSLPPTLKLLKKLRTLHLQNCAVKDISVVGKLASLEILHIYDCYNIEELPESIGRLNRLRDLELSRCRCLKRIVPGVISSLFRLEELKIIDSFDKWEAKGNQSNERNAGLSELESLPNLTCLEIDIFDCNFIAQEIYLSHKLVRYRISSCKVGYIFYGVKYKRNISLTLPKNITVGNWIRQLVRSTQSLILTGDGSNNFNLVETESLRNLSVTDCSTMKRLVNAIDCKFPVLEQLYLKNLIEVESIVDGTIPEGSNSFQKLQTLCVENLPKLKHLWKNLNHIVSLGNLTSIFIYHCPNSRYLFSVAAVWSLVQLRHLEIGVCDSMEQVFWNEIESDVDASIIEFPKLEELRLYEMPNLVAFSQGFEIIEFPRLLFIQVENCPKLKTKSSKWNIKLEALAIRHCDTIEEVWWDEIEDEGNRHIIFPALTEMELSNLKCLTTFYRGVESIKFPNLAELRIGNLPRMNSFAPMGSEPTHDDHSLHFFCNQKVEIPCIHTLYMVDLQDNINKIWCRCVPNNFFHSLEALHIINVNGIRNLMSSSIAKNLVNLNLLCIKGCQDMVEVIADDKEVFVRTLFPILEWLIISNLHELRCFCPLNQSLGLPSLKTVEIVDCPVMETLTFGSLSTPNLRNLHVNDEPIETNCLNAGIRDQFMTESQEGDNDIEYPIEEVDLEYPYEDEKRRKIRKRRTWSKPPGDEKRRREEKYSAVD